MPASRTRFCADGSFMHHAEKPGPLSTVAARRPGQRKWLLHVFAKREACARVQAGRSTHRAGCTTRRPHCGSQRLTLAPPLPTFMKRRRFPSLNAIYTYRRLLTRWDSDRRARARNGRPASPGTGSSRACAAWSASRCDSSCSCRSDTRRALATETVPWMDTCGRFARASSREVPAARVRRPSVRHVG